MKHQSLNIYDFFLVVFVVFIVGCKSGNPQKEENTDAFLESDGAAKPVFAFVEHDLGNLKRGEEAGARFRFKNEGTSPLLIEKVKTGCGCTVAKYTRKPIKPGDAGFVEVIFDSTGKSGMQFQQVSVYFKGLDRPIQLSLVAKVTD